MLLRQVASIRKGASEAEMAVFVPFYFKLSVFDVLIIYVHGMFMTENH